jgi:hypothetical protein
MGAVTFVPFVVAIVLSAATYGLGASNAKGVIKGGGGSATVSGYSVSTVHYHLNPSDPNLVDAVSFTVDPAPPPGATTKVRLSSADSTYYLCSSGAYHTCATTSTPVRTAAVDELTVIIGQ